MEPTETKDAGIVPTTTQDRASTPSVDEKKPQAQNGSPQDAEILAALESYVPGTAEEKRLVRKIDFILLPLLWWMYILAYLDRGNIANANAAGMSDDLGLSDTQYSLLVSLFFLAYVIFEVPSNMILMKIKPSIYLSTIIWVWGCVVIAMSQTKNASGFMAGRFFLGAIEAGLFPGAIFILTCWYTKKEVGKRFCIFYTSGCVAPALGGIMAGAVIEGLEGVRGIPGWRWLLLIEGVITVTCGLGLYLLLPNYPLNSRMLTPEQRILAHVRIMRDRDENRGPAEEEDQLTPFQAFRAVLADKRIWFFLVVYICNTLAMTITYFIPVILQDLGYAGTKAQWMTVPIWVCGAIFQLFWSYTSDRTQDRRWHNTGLIGLSAVTCIVSLAVTNGVAKYVMMCFLIGGMYTALPLILNWVSETFARPERKRSIAIAFVNASGHTTFIYGSYLWPSSQAPRNFAGFGTLTAVLCIGTVLAALLPVIFKHLPNPEQDVVEEQRQETVTSANEKSEA